MLVLSWTRREPQGEDDLEDDPLDLNPAPLPAPPVLAVWVVALLHPANLTPNKPGAKDTCNCRRRAAREAWQHLRPLITPHINSAPPMEFGNRGRKGPLQAPNRPCSCVLCASGKVTGVCYRPYTEEGTFPIATHLTWVTMPLAARTTLPRAWALLDKQATMTSHLAGLFPGDSPGKIGVRTRGGGGGGTIPGHWECHCGDAQGCHLGPGC